MIVKTDMSPARFMSKQAVVIVFIFGITPRPCAAVNASHIRLAVVAIGHEIGESPAVGLCLFGRLDHGKDVDLRDVTRLFSSRSGSSEELPNKATLLGEVSRPCPSDG